MKKLTDKLSDSKELNALDDHNLPVLKGILLIETIKSAFGLSTGGRNRKPSDEAWIWLLSKDIEPFSFSACCREYGVDPDKMLDWLRWYQRKKSS